MTPQSLTEFLGKVESGDVKKQIISQPIPENNNGPIKTVVGNTVEEIILDPSKDVLLMIYAPWCAHS